MYRKVIENPYIRISIRRLKSKKRTKILGSRFAEAVPPAESLKDRRGRHSRGAMAARLCRAVRSG